jgi:hypothetical protein
MLKEKLPFVLIKLLPNMVCGDTQTATSTPMSGSKDQIL